MLTNRIDAPGGFSFIRGGRAFSLGVRANDDHSIIRVILRRPVPWSDGFTLARTHLQRLGRPPSALCAVELRSPSQRSFEEFDEFNEEYRSVLDEWELGVGTDNPVARSNVVPLQTLVSETSMFAFSYTEPRPAGRRTFVISGATELRNDDFASAAIVRPGESSTDAIREKTMHVMSTMTNRLNALGVRWCNVAVVNVYLTSGVDVVGDALLPRLGPAASSGISWFAAKPPIVGVEFEMDVASVSQTTWLETVP